MAPPSFVPSRSPGIVDRAGSVAKAFERAVAHLLQVEAYRVG